MPSVGRQMPVQKLALTMTTGVTFSLSPAYPVFSRLNLRGRAVRRCADSCFCKGEVERNAMQKADCEVGFGDGITALGNKKDAQNLVKDLEWEKHNNDAKPQARIGKREDAADRNRQIQTGKNLSRGGFRAKNLVHSGKHSFEPKPDRQTHVACDEDINDER